MRNGQNVLVYAPRRYGKSSLVLRAAQQAMEAKALVGYVDLMKTPTKERFAAALAKTIYSDIDSSMGQVFERAAELFREPAGRALDGGRPQRRLAPLLVPGRAPQGRPRRHDRAAARAARRAGRRAEAARRDDLRRVPGDSRARQAVPEPDAGGVPGAAGGEPRLPRQQAAHPGKDLQRQERAVLAEREATRDRADPAGAVRRLSPRAIRRLGKGHRPRRRWRGCSKPPAATRTARRSWPTSCGSWCRREARPPCSTSRRR